MRLMTQQDLVEESRRPTHGQTPDLTEARTHRWTRSRRSSVATARQLGMIFALVALIIFFQIWTGGLTLTPDNVINIIQQNSYILVLAIGMVLVIIAGHIDLSVGSVAAFVGIVRRHRDA